MPALKKRRKGAKKAWNKRKRESKDSNRPKKFKQWDNESMLLAIAAVQNGEMGKNAAAREFGIPASTLKDRLSGRVEHGRKPGPAPYLTEDEETELAQFLIECGRLGYGKTKREVIFIVQNALEKKGIDLSQFRGEGWWIGFKRRHLELSLRSADPLSMVRANTLTQETIDAYFDLLEDTLTDTCLTNKETLIYNMDETGVPLDHKQLKRIAQRGTKKVHGRASGNKSQITVVACANAAGNTLPPMVIFKGERFNHEYSKGEVPGTLYGMSKQGWIDSELFFLWLRDLFLKNIPPARPVLLLLDGHSTHYTPDAVREAQKEGVIMLCLPPNTTHAAQPLDVSFFGPLKRHWSSVCHSYMAENPGKCVTKFQFSSLFRQAWYKAIKPEVIVAGFRKAGICPLDRTAIKPGSSESYSTTTEDEDSPTDSEEHHSVSDEESFEQPGDNEVEVFTDLEMELFQTRFDNGYDLFIDPKYVSWLLQYHPESLPNEVRDFNYEFDEDMEIDGPFVSTIPVPGVTKQVN